MPGTPGQASSTGGVEFRIKPFKGLPSNGGWSYGGVGPERLPGYRPENSMIGSTQRPKDE